MKLRRSAMDAVRVLPGRATRALGQFFRLESAGGIVLVAAAALALVAANSPFQGLYGAFREIPVSIQIGGAGLAKPLLLWINDGLMALFFLVVALEIKREILCGQLSSREQILLPLVCAVGGVLLPAALYAGVNHGDATAIRGWAVPAATDIAFALGVLSLLGKRVPLAMKVLLSTIAIVDDLIAILIIAIFYTEQLALAPLLWAGVALAALFALNRLRVVALAPYLLVGLVLWVCVLKSGVHATLAGVAVGLMIPHVDTRNRVDDESEYSPLEWLMHALHPWVAFAVVPLFAFANAGLSLAGMTPRMLLDPVPLGIALGLLLGKPVGIVGIALLGRAVGLVRWPDDMNFGAFVGMGLLCGIGFTMSLFISSLAFNAHPPLFDESVLGVLGASTIAAVAGYLWLRLTPPPGNR